MTNKYTLYQHDLRDNRLYSVISCNTLKECILQCEIHIDTFFRYFRPWYWAYCIKRYDGKDYTYLLYK